MSDIADVIEHTFISMAVTGSVVLVVIGLIWVVDAVRGWWR